MIRLNPLERSQILPYPEYNEENEISDPGCVALNHSWAEDDFQPEVVRPEDGDYASDLEVMLDPVSSDSALRVANFEEVLSNIIRVKGFKCVPDKPKPVMAITTDVGKAVSNLHIPLSSTFQINQYLDDWLNTNQSYFQASRAVVDLLNLLIFHVFFQNLGKSQLVTTQNLVFLGEEYDLVKGLVRPLEKRRSKIRAYCQNFLIQDSLQ